MKSFISVLSMTCISMTLFFSFVASARVVTMGKFMPTSSGHRIEGTFEIHKKEARLVLVFNSDFNVDHGPDLRVVLRNSMNNIPMQIIAPLKQFEGEQAYELPLSEEELLAFDQVVIYCAKFHVDFGIGNFMADLLQPPLLSQAPTVPLCGYCGVVYGQPVACECDCSVVYGQLVCEPKRN